ncbi:MAG: TRAP transporter small permease subunit [Kiloniellaceae bacterium]
MDRLIERARTFSRYGAWFGGALIIVAAVIVGVDVVIRKAFNVTIGGADELSGFALAISSAWAFGFALLERAHVRIDSVYVWLPPRVCAVLDILGLIVFTLFMGLFAWQAYGVFRNSVAMDTRTMTVLETPLRFPQFLWVLGLSVFVLIALLLLFRSLVALASGDVATVQRRIGSKSAREDTGEEVRRIEERADDQIKTRGEIS